MQIYQPLEDSYLLSESLKKYLESKSKSIKILDMGTGSGIQAKTCESIGFKNILTADINKQAVKQLKKQGFKSVNTDLFSNINKNQKFDLIIFNPPYLPEHKYDTQTDITGGKKGYETILNFLTQAKKDLSKNGEILLLFSSSSKPKIIKQKAEQLGYKFEILTKKRIFFEELFVYKFYI